jgi:hypothetical protein
MAHTDNPNRGAASGDPQVQAQRLASREQRIAERHAAIAVLAKAVGYDLGGNSKLEKQVEKLTKQVSDLTAERDDALGKIKALKEALK